MMRYLGSPSWRAATLEDLVFFQRGFDITKAQQKEGDVPVISSSGIKSFHADYKAIGPGVVIGRKGTLGSVYYCNDNYWPHDTTLWSKDFKGNNPRFVYYALKTLSLERFDAGAANPTLNRNHIHGLPITIPELPTQNQIAETLSKYDDLIENNKRRIDLLEESARQLYREWFVRLRFPGHEHVKVIDGIPEGWVDSTAFDVVEILSGGTPKTSNSEFWDGDIPFFTPKDATKNVYAKNTLKNITATGLNSCSSGYFPKDTLFITARGTVGKLNLAQVPMGMNQSCYALVGKQPLTQYFLYFAMGAGIQQVKSRAVGAVFDAVIKDTFKVIPFVVPTENMIHQFTEYVTPTIGQIDILTSENGDLIAARDLLLPKLMSGDIVA